MLYEFDGLLGVPHQGRLLWETGRRGLPAWRDISYHPTKRWLKIWYDAELSADEYALLKVYVEDSTGVVEWKQQGGSVLFELVSVNGKRWERHRRQVVFPKAFPESPKIEIMNAKFDGAANIELEALAADHFQFSVVAVNGGGQIRGLTTVAFDWEATWEC